MYNLRIKFTKNDQAIYISHLDINRTISRALSRANIDIYYTNGFNPHAYLVFGPPISLGYYAKNEILDIRTNTKYDNEEFLSIMNKNLPKCMQFVEAYEPSTKLSDICYADYSIVYRVSNKIDKDFVYNNIKQMLAKGEILVEKKSKKGISTANLLDFVKSYSFEVMDDRILINCVLDCSSTVSANPILFTKAIDEYCDINYDSVSYTRNNFLNSDMKIFY